VTNPTFSVIVPTRSRPHLLREAVGSVLGQTFQDFECIVVDDAGTEPVDLPSDPRVHVIRHARQRGAAAARNTGLSASSGTYVTFLDDDDLFTPDRLVIALEGLSKAPIALCWRSTREHSETISWCADLNGDLQGHILEAPVPNVGQVALNRERAPLFDERFRVSEDVEWWLRAASVGDAVTIRRVGYILRHHGAERQTGRLGERLDCRLLLLETHAEYFAANRRAAAYQWRRVGGIARALGARRLQRQAFRRSLALDPGIHAAAHLALAYWPSPGGGEDPNDRTASP
jgi:glycosyltransferase involved in cell wall biosynthesis